MRLTDLDRAVLMAAQAGYLDAEIQEQMDLSVEALRAALDRLATWLAPTAASNGSIDPAYCLPFLEELCGAA